MQLSARKFEEQRKLLTQEKAAIQDQAKPLPSLKNFFFRVSSLNLNLIVEIVNVIACGSPPPALNASLHGFISFHML